MKKKLCGRRDGSVSFGDYLSSGLQDEGADRCPGQPSLYYLRDINVKREVRQDDFHARSSSQQGLDEFKKRVSKHVMMKCSEVFGLEGACSHLRCTCVKTREGICVTGTQKHTDEILERPGVKDCRGAPTPITQTRRPDDEEDGPLPPDVQERYRQCVGIASFVRQLKPETGFAMKELSHRLKTAYPADEARLKRYARYLQGRSSSRGAIG